MWWGNRRLVSLVQTGRWPEGEETPGFARPLLRAFSSAGDGAERIPKQYNQRLPTLEANVPDHHQLPDHVIGASHGAFGENTPAALAGGTKWRAVVSEQGPWALLDLVGRLRRLLRPRCKRAVLAKRQQYVGKPMDMLDQSGFVKKGLRIGSGPTQGSCKTLTARLKGRRRRWDKADAEGIMALAAIRSSGLWDRTGPGSDARLHGCQKAYSDTNA